MRSMVEGACRKRYRLGRSLSTTAFGGGPQCWVAHAPGMGLDCRGQSNPTLLRERI